jgi:hypothetical protein
MNILNEKLIRVKNKESNKFKTRGETTDSNANNNEDENNKIPESMQNMQIFNDAIISFFVNFDSSGKFSMFCFGGKMKNSNWTNNCFSANFDMLNPIVENWLDGIINYPILNIKYIIKLNLFYFILFYII